MSVGAVVAGGFVAAGLLLVGFLLGRRRAPPAPDVAHHHGRHLRSVYDWVPAGVFVRSADGIMTHVNPVAAQILGMSSDEVAGRAAFDPTWEMIDEDGNLVPLEDFPSMATLRTGEAFRNAVRGLSTGDPDGTRWLLINTVPHFVPGTRDVEEVVVMFLDVTGRMKADEALAASRDRLAAYLDVAGVILLALDPQGRI
ncbi:MAG TPA: PAS domain S-box protein, partial [Longimicrobiales bacterium]|nr:PAS domain S-box protein [Longimicrobiales bacterium]